MLPAFVDLPMVMKKMAAPLDGLWEAPCASAFDNKSVMSLVGAHVLPSFAALRQHLECMPRHGSVFVAIGPKLFI